MTNSVDSYEMGTTKIFETAVEEFFVHENTLKELPKQKPDCIFGFKNTEYIGQFLEQISPVHVNSNSEIMQSFIRTSPLKHDSPIFPFLALEAKSDSSTSELLGYPDSDRIAHLGAFEPAKRPQLPYSRGTRTAEAPGLVSWI